MQALGPAGRCSRLPYVTTVEKATRVWAKSRCGSPLPRMPKTTWPGPVEKRRTHALPHALKTACSCPSFASSASAAA